jgi:hypothetical protein
MFKYDSRTIHPVTGDESNAELALKQGQRVVDEQRQFLAEIDTKAVKILRLNVLLIGIAVSVLSISSRSGTVPTAILLNGYTVTGGVLFLSSTTAAGTAYTRSNVTVGPSSSALDQLASTNTTPTLVKTGLAKSYAEWVEQNWRAIERTRPLVVTSITTLLTALVFVATGITEIVLGTLPPMVFAVPFAACLVVGWRTSLFAELRAFLPTDRLSRRED